MRASTQTNRPLFLTALLLGLGLSANGCKSELDGKQSANVGAAKTDGSKTDAAKVDPSAKANAGANPNATVKELKLDSSASKVGFVGAKVTGDHKGEFSKVSGKCEVQGDQLKSIVVEVETASVSSDDEKLTGHLKSPDFFDVEKFPKAVFTATSFTPNATNGNTHTVAGDLELHGVKKPVSFDANISANDQAVKGKAEFKINRKDFSIVYPGKPDDLIKDEVLLKLDLTCKA